MAAFSEEELNIAKSVDLVDLASAMHIPLKRKGRYFQVEGMDSLMIFNRSSWYRYSQSVGGSTIDFLMYFNNLTFKESVSWLLDFAGYIRMDISKQEASDSRKVKETVHKRVPEGKVPFVLPEKSKNCRGLYAYLVKRRKLSKEVIRYGLEKGLMYESLPYHNIVFLGKDADGNVKFASQRGIRDAYGKPFKGDVPGNDKQYGVNLVYPDCQEVNVYEAAIDSMSDMDFRRDFKTNILVLGMVSDGPLQKFLKEQPHIKKIAFCLDNDLPGRISAKKLAEKYVLAGYEVTVRLPPFGKDYNAFLQYERENRALWNQLNRSKRIQCVNVRETEEISEKAENRRCNRKNMRQRSAMAR